jgi:hypothetical protein
MRRPPRRRARSGYDPGNTAFTPLDFVSCPWAHSLLMVLVWGAGFALAYQARRLPAGRIKHYCKLACAISANGRRGSFTTKLVPCPAREHTSTAP